MKVAAVKAQIPTVTFLPILNTRAVKGAHMSKSAGKAEEDFVCTVVLCVHKVL